jgi:hypothetical protein
MGFNQISTTAAPIIQEPGTGAGPCRRRHVTKGESTIA